MDYHYDMRIEKDSIGPLEIPDDAYYGIQSLRAAQNFPISGTQIHPLLIRSYLLLKRAAAIANKKTHSIEPKKSKAIIDAIDKLLKLNFDDDLSKYFIIDAYQAGAGTSQNMNINEVVANKANELLGHKLGSYHEINPNDHVNMSQSTNDTYPTVMRLALLTLSKELLYELKLISISLGIKAHEFDHVIKSGRTHLQDAVPIRLGQEFKAYQYTTFELIKLIQKSQDSLRVLGIGGSAIGTGINVPKGYRDFIILELKKLFDDYKLTISENLIAETQSQLPLMIFSNALRATALEFTRIMNDLRLMSSGPHTGLSEINLPAGQPGSSIMPGKINPSILEMGNQVLFKVIGNDSAMAFAIQAGQLELNVMMPLMAQLMLESSQIMTNAFKIIREKCIDGISANVEQCKKHADHTLQIATILNPIIGYDKTAELIKEALKDDKSIMDLIKEKNILGGKKLNLEEMTKNL